jgi:hypothetical protein
MKKRQETDKIDVLALLRILRREYDGDDPVFAILTRAIRAIEELRIRVEDLQGKLRQGDNGSH